MVEQGPPVQAPAGPPLVSRTITERSSVESSSDEGSAVAKGAGSGCSLPALPKGQSARTGDLNVPEQKPAQVTFYDGGRAVVFGREREWKTWELCDDCTEHTPCARHQRAPVWERCDNCKSELDRCPLHQPRSHVSLFTKRSRLNLRRNLNRLKRWVVPVFVTCTYPADECPSPDSFGRHVQRYKVAYRRAFPKTGFVWKVEFTRKGVPHLHLLVFGVAYPTFRAWHVPTWIRCIGTDHPNAAYVANLGVEPVRSSVSVSAYVGKYVWGDKTYQEEGGLEWAGRRWWGLVGKPYLPWSEEVPVDAPDEVVVRLMRYARKRGSFYNPKWRHKLGWHRPWWQSKARRHIRSRSYVTLELELDPTMWATLLGHEISRYEVETGARDVPLPDVGAGLRVMEGRAGLR